MTDKSDKGLKLSELYLVGIGDMDYSDGSWELQGEFIDLMFNEFVEAVWEMDRGIITCIDDGYYLNAEIRSIKEV
jgi:hypothetical protein